MSEIPEASMWFEFQRKMYFQLDIIEGKLKCKKNINNRYYSIIKDLPSTYDELNRLLNRFVNLPDEFWKPID